MDENGYVILKSGYMSFETVHKSFTKNVLQDGQVCDEIMDWKDNSTNGTYVNNTLKWYADEDKIPKELLHAMRDDIKNVFQTFKIKGKPALLKARIIIRERNSEDQLWHITKTDGDGYFAIWPYHPFQYEHDNTGYYFNVIEVSYSIQQ